MGAAPSSAGPAGCSSGLPPPPQVVRDAAAAATSSAIARARSAGAAAGPALAARDDAAKIAQQTHNSNNQHKWQTRYDFKQRRTVFVNHHTRTISHEPPAMQCLTSSARPSSICRLAASLPFADLDVSAFAAGMDSELRTLMSMPQPAHSIRVFERDGLKGDEPAEGGPIFVRLMDSVAGLSIRRHADLAALFVGEVIQPDVIRTEDELNRARRDCFLKQPPTPSPSGWSNPDPKVLASVVGRLSEKTVGKRSKQILTHPTAAQLLAILDSTPNGSLASEQTAASSPFEALWLELESSARILTLNLNEIEMLVKLSLSLSAKLGGLTDILRCVSLWQRIKSLYGSMSLASGSGGLRIPHLLHALNRFSLDVLNAIWSRVNENEAKLGVHAFGAQFRHMLLARPEIKLAPSATEVGAAAAGSDSNAVGISTAISFLLAHVGLLAETHLFFSRFNHLRLPVSAHTPQAAAAPQANARPTSLSIPLVLDIRAAGFSALVESLEECLSVRHNERVNALLSSHSLMHVAPITSSLPPGLAASPSSASSSCASSTQRSASPVDIRTVSHAASSSASAASSVPPAAVSATVSALLTPAAISNPDPVKSLKLLLRLLSNIASAPSQEKFRRIKSSHPSFQGLIGRFPERMAVLRSVGFEDERKAAGAGSNATQAASGNDVPASVSLSFLPSSNVFSVPISPSADSRDTHMDPASSPTPPMLPSFPAASPLQSLPITSFTSAALSPSDASPSALMASSMAAHTPSATHNTPSDNDDTFLFLPTSSLDLVQLEATISLLRSSLTRLQSLNSQAASTLVDKHSSFTTIPSPSATTVPGAVAPPFPFLPHSVSPVHPQASQQDFSHVLSLLRLFFYAARSWHIDPHAWSATTAAAKSGKPVSQPLLLRSGVSAWRKLVEMLLALLETPQLDGASLFGSAAVAASAASAAIALPDADQEQHRAEKDRVVAVLLEAFPSMPVSCQVSVVQSALRDDVLRTGLANLVQESPGCFHLLPRRSASGPFLSAWERILASRALPPSSLAVAAPPDQSVLSLMGDAQLVHNLIAQFEGGTLVVPSSSSTSGPSKLHTFWSSAARKVQEHLLKTQHLSSMSALLATAQSHPNAAQKHGTNESTNTSVYPSPILSPQSASAVMGLPLPSLSLGPRLHSDPASAAAVAAASSASPLGSPSSSSSASLHAPQPREASLWPRSIHSPVPILPSPLTTPTTKATAAAPLVYPTPVQPASANSSVSAGSRASPQLSPFPSPSPTGSPFSPSPSDWIAGSKAGTLSPGTNVDDVDLAVYSGILEGLLSGLQSPESLSALSVASAKAQSSIRFQFAFLFQSLLQSWFTRSQCPLTSYDVLLAPSLLKQAMSMLICSATKSFEQGTANVDDQSDRMDESDLEGAASSPKPTTPIERSLRLNPVFSLLTPMLMQFSALLDQLAHVTLDPLFLSQLYSLHAAIGGFDAWTGSSEDDSGLLRPFVRAPLVAAPSRLEYCDYFKSTLPSDTVLDFIRAPSDGGESELQRVLKAIPTMPSSTLNCATKLAALGASSVIPATFLPLPALIREAVERHVFGVSAIPPSTQLLFPTVAQGRLHHSSLLSCPLCSRVHSDAESLFHHAQAAQGDGLCASDKARASVLRHSVLWTISTVSRSLASAHPSSDLLGVGNLTASQTDVRVQPDGTPIKPDATATSDDVASVRSQAIPKTTAQWLKSDIVKAGLESVYLELSAADSSNPLSQQLPLSSGGAAADVSHISFSDLTASAKLFPFFHSLPASLNASKANSPSRSQRTLSAEINASSADEKLADAAHMTDELKKDGRSASGSLSQPRKSVSSVSSESHEKVSVGGSGIPLSGFALRSPECPAKESSTASPGFVTKEESAEMVDQSPTTLSVHAVHIPPSVVTPLQQSPSTGMRSKESQDQLRKSLTITTPTHNNNLSLSGNPLMNTAVTPTGPPARGEGKTTPSFAATPNLSVLLPASFTSFPPSPTVDTCPHASFLSHLIFGDGDTRLLDDALMSHVSMRVYATHRKMVGESGVRASRAILAALLKHTGKVEMAVEYNRQLVARKNSVAGERASGLAAAAIKPPPSLLKLWKLSSDLLSDLITLHQNGLHSYCLSPGCDQTVLEESSVHGSYRCGNGHVAASCLAKESVRYETLAERVMQSAEFLLKLKPAYTAQESAANPSAMLAKLQAARVRKLLRVKPVNMPFSPSGLADPSSSVPAPDVGSLKRSGSSTLSSWSPSPRTPVASSPSPPPSFPAVSSGLPPLHRPAPQTPTGLSLSRGHSDSNGPTEVGVSLISPRTFPSAVQLLPFDDESKRRGTASPSHSPAAASAHSSARKVRDSMRRELAQRRWQELRAELLASRMPSLLRAAAPPISSLVMAFCRNLSIDTALRAQQMERQMRAAVILAEHRTRGLESMAYLMRHAPVPYKALSLVQWNACIQAWQHTNVTGSSSLGSVLDRALHAEGSSGALPARFPPLLIPHRYDFLLHAVGPSLLTQVQESFFVGLGINLGLMHRCMHVLGLHAPEQEFSLVEEPVHTQPLSALRTITRLRRALSSSEHINKSSRSSPLFGPVLYTSSFNSSFAALALGPSEALSLLLLALNSWFVSYGSCAQDYAFLHTAQVLALLQQVCFHFPEVDSDVEEAQSAPRSRTGSAESNSSGSAASSAAVRAADGDRHRCLAVGRQARRLFRLLAMSALTRQQAFNAVAEEEAGSQEAAVTAESQSVLGDSVGLHPDSFEASILHALFARLDFLLHHRLNSRMATAHLHSFEHPQDERDCFEAISILLLAGAALHIRLELTKQRHDGQDTETPGLEFNASGASLSTRCFHLLSDLLHPSIFPKLSMRCQRRSIGLCNLLLPMVTPATIEMLWNQQAEAEAHDGGQSEDMGDAEMPASAPAAAVAAPTSPCGESSQLVAYLLLSIGYYSCGKFLDRSVDPFPHSHARCSQLVSELLSLVRNLHNSKCWMLAVSAVLADALSKLKHTPLEVREQSALDAFYSAYAATLVFGGYLEPLRIGGRVLIHRVSCRAEKLAQRESSGVSATGSDDARGTIVGFETHHAIVIRDGDDTQRLHVLPVGALEPLPRYPCIQPFHLYGEQGRQNLIAVVRFLNGAFHNTVGSPTSDTNAGFALFPMQPEAPTQRPSREPTDNSSALFAQYMHAQLKLHAMRALLHCISLTLTRPELVEHSVQQYAAATAGSSTSVPSPPSLNSIDVLVQCILKETIESPDPPAVSGSSSSRSALPLMSHLLSLAQQVIPLSSSLGKLDDLCSKMQEMHALMHEQADERAARAPSVPSALGRGVHADLLSRGMQLFSNDSAAATNWAKRKQQELRAMQEESKRATDKLNSIQIQPLLDLGFDEALCKRAVLLHNGDAGQSLHWLKEHGANEVASLRRGVIQESWGLEGVDFYQEKGHWAPRVSVAAEAADETTARSSSTVYSSRKLGAREETKDSLDSSQASMSRPPRSPHGLPHVAPPMDPYRRLALYTAPQMAVQSFRSELVHHQLTGRPLANSSATPVQRANSRGIDAVPCAGWSLEASDVRAGVGQRLRISQSWVSQQLSLGRRSDGVAVPPPAFRWYFLTEDNHWAPLDAQDMLKLDACYAAGSSFCWIGVEEKTPSLIRLDKMCMYSEITGHGRPLRRKMCERNPLEPARVEAEQPTAAATAASSALPHSLLLFDSLTPDRKNMAEGLSMMGFSREWCALALTHTQFHTERAADWLLTEANTAKCEAHDRAIAAQQAELDKLAADEAATAAASVGSMGDDVKDDHPLTPEESDQVSKKKQKLIHLLGPGLAAGWSLAGPSAALLATEEVDLDTVFEQSGELGTVLALSRNFTSSTSAAALDKSKGVCSAKVLMEWDNEEINCRTRGWVPLASLEWDLEQFARLHADYTRMHETAFGGTMAASMPVGHRKLTHTMQQQISSVEHLGSVGGQKNGADASSSSAAASTGVSHNTLFNLAVDLSSSTFIVYSRRIVLLLLYLLSLPPKPSTAPTSPVDPASSSAALSSPPLYSLQAVGSVHGSPLELIANLTAGAFVRILKLVSVDSNASFSACSGNGGLEGMAAVALTLPIEDTRIALTHNGDGDGPSQHTLAQDGAEMMPSTPGLVPRNRLDVDFSQLLQQTSAAASGFSSSSAVLPPHPPSIDVWLVLSTILHNAGPLFSSPSRDQLFALLLDDVKRTLHSCSYFVRDIDTEHPYQSAVTEHAQEVHIENAAALLVTFDRRCNINQSHACLAFYSDRACTDELAVFSGSADEFSHIVVPGSRFFYSFRSGSVRSKPYEFGHRFRVRPLGFSLASEADAFNVVGPALATATNLGLVPATLQHQQQAAIGSDNASVVDGSAPSPARAFAFSLGWPLLVLLSDSPSLSDTVLSHSMVMDLLQSMLRYLTVCRSPCKVLVTRALTSLCVRVRNPLSASLFEILLRVMEQLYESNTASGWGSSPFLCALVDLIRLRPMQFKLSDSDLWSIDSMDNRPASWFFLTVLRAESLSKALLHSSRLPHVRVVERAMHDLSDVEVLRWCLKQPELCLKLHKQVRGWNNSRREWMQNINGFSAMAQAAAVLIQLRDSLLPECFRLVSWTAAGGFLASQDWEARLKLSTSVSHIAGAYMDLEAALKWGDQFPEGERAFGDTWSSRRGDWLAAMRGLALGHTVKVSSPSEALDARWTRAMDESFVSHLDDLTSKSARRLMSMTFRDIEPLTPEQLSSGADAATGMHPLRNVSVEQLRARFAVLKLLSTDYMRLLPVVDLSFSAVSWTLGSVVKPTSKSLIFQQSKMYLWRSMLGRLYSEERPQFVILNRHEAARARTNPSSRLQHSLFYQLYCFIGLLSDPSSLRRRGQSWMVKFVGEGGHDAGGMYNESLVEICNELQGETPQEAHGAATGEGMTAASVAASSQPLLPLFRLCPNGHHVIGEHRASFLPNPGATSPLCLSMFEFVGRLCGICCLDNNRALPLTLASLVWKCMVSEPLTMMELKRIDQHAWNLINLMRAKPSSPGADGAGTEVTEATFEYLFPDLTFSVEVSAAADSLLSVGSSALSKRVIDLIPNGRHIAVTYANRVSYSTRLERFYLRRYNTQLEMMMRGMAAIIPIDFISSPHTHAHDNDNSGSVALESAMLNMCASVCVAVSLWLCCVVFRGSQLEVLLTGSPVMDVSLLRSKTEYRGNLSARDKHIVMFWEVMDDMKQEQRAAFLQFVWGRNRLPSSALGFGKDLFKISDHAQAIATGTHDAYLPVAHTCFFAMELPRYSCVGVLRSKLLYAISNCSSIDGDATHEGRANMAMAWGDEEDE